MLGEEEVKTMLVVRLYLALSAAEDGNALYFNHVMGQVRGLLAVLIGEPPIAALDGASYLRAAGIPCTEHEGGEYSIPDDWLLAHGFTVTEDSFCHTRFRDW